jgi:hypothetical protein
MPIGLWSHRRLWQSTCLPFFVMMSPAGPTAGFLELQRFIEAHRPCGTLAIHAPDCGSALGFPIVLDCGCGDLLVRWVTVQAAFQDVIDSAWPSTAN